MLYLETGQRFRDFIEGPSFSSMRSREIMDMGALQPSFLATWMWANELIEKMTGREHLVIDGSPRKLNEATALASALSFYGRAKPIVIHLNVTRDWARERLMSRGRADDIDIADIEKRLDWFDKEVAPAIEFFRNDERFQFLDINGERSIEIIQQDILDYI